MSCTHWTWPSAFILSFSVSFLTISRVSVCLCGINICCVREWSTSPSQLDAWLSRTNRFFVVTKHFNVEWLCDNSFSTFLAQMPPVVIYLSYLSQLYEVHQRSSRYPQRVLLPSSLFAMCFSKAVPSFGVYSCYFPRVLFVIVADVLCCC